MSTNVNKVLKTEAFALTVNCYLADYIKLLYYKIIMLYYIFIYNKLKNFHEVYFLVYLANFCERRLFSLCITNCHINIVIKHRLLRGSTA